MVKKLKLICNSGIEARELRQKLGLNQKDFWSRISITQSGGSRYESGRNMPAQLLYLLHLVYGTEKQAMAFVEWIRQPSNS